MGLIFMLLIAYPFIEQKVTGDKAHHNLLQRPRDAPVRTAIGAMAIAFYMVLTLAAMNDIIALKFHISLNATTWIGRIGMVVLPAIVYYITYRWCIGLQRSDRAVLEHGIETGIIKRLPHGAYIELHQPLGPGRRARPPDSAGVPGRRPAEADEQARLGRFAGFRQLPEGRSRRAARCARGGGARRRTQGAHRTTRAPGAQRLVNATARRTGTTSPPARTRKRPAAHAAGVGRTTEWRAWPA